MENVKIDIAIIGAGVVGLMMGRSLKLRYPQKEIVIFEAAPYVGEHASGRNSGVLHAGLYYDHDSLKHQFCHRGRQIWKEQLAKELKISLLNCGKFIVGKKEEEQRIVDLFDKAKKNDAQVEWVSQKKIQEIGSYLPGAYKAFFAKETSVIDPSEMLQKLRNSFENLGGILLVNHRVHKVSQEGKKEYLLSLDELQVECNILINAAGGGATDLREDLGLIGLENSFVQGHYLKTFAPFFKEALLYPLPEDDNLKGLGIHTCLDFDGTVKFGPDTLNSKEIDYIFHDKHFQFLKERVSKQFSIEPQKLLPDFVGVRSKIFYHKKLYKDFWIQGPQESGLQNYIELCGIESPGLTSAPALSEFVVEIIEKHCG